MNRIPVMSTDDQLSQLKRALLALKEMRLKLNEVEQRRSEPIAIIGMGCRFPGGVDNPERFWELLHMGVDAITEIPLARADLREFYDPNPEIPGKMYFRHGGFLPTVDGFDPEFFGISPREATGMDPQQRLLLEVAWEALERAGQNPETLVGSLTGVFIGIMNLDYMRLQTMSTDFTGIDPYFGTGNGTSFLSGRLSYILGLQGPSLALDTACSSSLIALHLACQSLRLGECAQALVGGVNLVLAPDTNISLSKIRAVAADGRCKTFAAQADGYARGEGCGVLVLKRLSDAQADGDTIMAVVRGSAVNHDGPSGGLTVPSGPAQQALIRQALAQARVEPAAISYIEAHGTGTKLGDPIEVNALAQVLSPGRTQPLYIGSVKTNIGHLEAAAGIAGIIKVVLALQHEAIPPHLHFQEPNPLIDWEHIPINVPTVLTPWPRQQGVPRIAGISSFGMSGSNAHVLLEEAPVIIQEQEVATEDIRPHLLTLSARTQPALEQLAQRFIDFLHLNTHCPIADICYTALSGRSHFPFRLATTTASTTQLIASLTAFTQGTSLPNLSTGLATTSPKVAFLFSGQGSQYIGMGLELYHTQPVFQRALDQCNQFLEPHLGLSLLHLLTSPLLDETRFTQPALFALQYALTQMWHAWGVQPSAVIGHSVGEYAAACIAGVFSLEDGLKLITARARLMHALPQIGGMVAVLASETQVAAVLVNYPTITIAAINGPTSVVLSGEKTALTTVVNQLAMQGYKVKPLVVSHAFHSALMEPMLAEFTQVARTVIYQEPQLSLISNVTGALVADGQVSCAEYWVRHARAAVRFEQGMQTLWRAGYEVYLELGPAPVLLGMGKCCVPEAQQVWLPSLRKGRPEADQALESLGALYTTGVKILWAEATKVHKVPLPTYPFQREPYWAETAQLSYHRKAAPIQLQSLPFPGKPLYSPVLKATVYESQFDPQHLPFLQDHRVYGMVLVPGASHIALILATLAPGLTGTITNLTFLQALVLLEGETRAVQLVLEPPVANLRSFRIFSADAQDKSTWTLYAEGQLCSAILPTPGFQEDHSTLQSRCNEVQTQEELYQVLAERGLQLGPSFRWVERVWRREGEALGQLREPPTVQQHGVFPLHPGLIDACIHVLGAALPKESSDFNVYLPIGLDNFHFYRPAEGQLWCHAHLRPQTSLNGDTIQGDLHLHTQDGELVAVMAGLSLKRASRQALTRINTEQDALYQLRWQPAPPPIPVMAQTGFWLVFQDRQGLGHAICEQLHSQDKAVVTVLHDSAYQSLGEGSFCINPDHPEDFSRLLQAVLEQATPCQGLLYLWSLDASLLEDDPQAPEREIQRLLALIQALITHQLPRLWVVTADAQAVNSNPIALSQAGLWGLGRVIAQEHPALWGGQIDVDASSPEMQAMQVLTEAQSGSGENQVAYRNNTRFIARLVRSPAPTGQWTVRPDRTYLITGGLTGLGLAVAGWLVDQGACNLVLVGRSHPNVATLARLATWEAQGVTINCIQGDVSVWSDMELVFRTIQLPLAGVFHSAGVLDDGVLAQQTAERFQRVLAPKVSGAWHLHLLTQHLSLDCFVLFSSVAALIGSAGQGNYAAGNAFLDALAQERYRRGLPAVSINWGPWTGAGMTADQDQSRWIRLGVDVIAPTIGLQTLGRILGATIPQVGVLPIAWETFVQQFPTGGVPPFFQEVTYQLQMAAMPTLLKTLEKAPPLGHRALLGEYVCDQAKKILRLAPQKTLNPDQPLNELGLDSLMAVELRNALGQALGRTLPATLLFDYPTVTTLTAYLADSFLALPDPAETALYEAVEDSRVQELEDLSDDEAEALLTATLATLNLKF